MAERYSIERYGSRWNNLDGWRQTIWEGTVLRCPWAKTVEPTTHFTRTLLKCTLTSPQKGTPTYTITQGDARFLVLKSTILKKRDSTWWCHRCGPGRISACVLGCCTPLPRRPRSRRSPWRRCSRGCCDTDVPGIRTPTPVSGGSWEQFCQPCPHFPVSRGFCHVSNSGIHQGGFNLSPWLPSVPRRFHQSGASVKMWHFGRLQ